MPATPIEERFETDAMLRLAPRGEIASPWRDNGGVRALVKSSAPIDAMKYLITKVRQENWDHVEMIWSPPWLSKSPNVIPSFLGGGVS